MNALEKPTVLNIYKCNLGIFVKSFMSDYSFREVPDSYRINGKLFKEYTLHNNCYFIPGATDIISFEYNSGTRSQPKQWQIIDNSLISDKIPETISLGELSKNMDEDDSWQCSGKYAKIGSLYNMEYEVVQGQWVDKPFEIKVLHEFTVDNWEKPVDTKVKLCEPKSFGEVNTQEVNLSSIVNYYELEKLVIPEPLMHTRPCYLSSQQVYKIIRAYVKENFDPKRCAITSDYDFCFTVKKKVHVKPYGALQYKSKGKKMIPYTVKKQEKEFVIFEMTYKGYDNKPEGYKGYTPVEEWRASSFEELKQHLKDYLEELIALLNAEVHECQHCEGTGHNVIKAGLPKNA